LGEQVLILLPGPPAELTPMLEDYVLPDSVVHIRPLQRPKRIFILLAYPNPSWITKSDLLFQRATGAEFTILAKLGLVDLDIFVSDKTKTRAARRLAKKSLARFERRSEKLFRNGWRFPLGKSRHESILVSQATLAMAESCTGGMLAKRLITMCRELRGISWGCHLLRPMR